MRVCVCVCPNAVAGARRALVPCWRSVTQSTHRNSDALDKRPKEARVPLVLGAVHHGHSRGELRSQSQHRRRWPSEKAVKKVSRRVVRRVVWCMVVRAGGREASEGGEPTSLSTAATWEYCPYAAVEAGASRKRSWSGAGAVRGVRCFCVGRVYTMIARGVHT